ncbi:MAG TPA: 3-alpha,7-alpha,12-alpha-trihydroxy-5-beta-cholest-24-enoyl-CoA hydratase [Myxococcales bacterium]|nr:3-alpha,7-alpha,12-alpha-trihydroxy-5-beta-cholest-24-enoyl-CoA hydratase [Myxococcales bacterium]HIM01557.1 3-alpha,7-alpha,12-alpha-trihydroxy-5-beta-cholest-24-enoyl-CoA hydratase [Myxococcales bacterium]
MPIDRDKALAHVFPPGVGEYQANDVILYHLGVGAGVPATNPGELEYTYEKNLKVLPSFPMVVNAGGADIFSTPGVEFNPALILHGAQDVEIHRPLPIDAKLTCEGRIADIFDKGKAALLITENRVRGETGEPLFTTRTSLFLRGEGGFGGPSGPSAGNKPPQREPDGIIESRTLPQQALLYRLCGDKSLLHCDPEFAAKGGFDRPIIHGLCSYGIVCKAVVDGVLGGDVTQVARYQARFSGVAYPGETYVTAYWKEADRILIEAKIKERDSRVISNACIILVPG